MTIPAFLSALREFARISFEALVQQKIPDPDSNFAYNKRIWEGYARSWRKEAVNVENPAITNEQKPDYLQHLGDEWGAVSDVDRIVKDFILPYVSAESVVAEIGVGGGRVATRVAGHVGQLYCFDISREMLKRAKAALVADSNVFFVLQTQPTLPAEYAGRFDFVYSFDTFVHFDLHLMWREFCIVRDILKDGGRAFIHTTNLIAPDGWKTFASQDKYRVETMYFVSPEIIRTLADHAHLKIVKASNVDPGSFYLNRDYLVVLEKTEPCPAESSK